MNDPGFHNSVRRSRYGVLLTAALVLLAACADGKIADVEFDLWTQEGEAEEAQEFVDSLAERYMEENESVTINVVRKDTEELGEDFRSSAIAGSAPELLWTVNDHAGPMAAAGIIQPIDDLYEVDDYIEPVVIGGEVYGMPVSSGTHLMLLYNRSMVEQAPENTDEMISIAQEHTAGETYGLVYNTTEPFWLVPWLGGFGGSVFAEDGVTPTLNTPEMEATLQFLYDLTHKHEITPVQADYGTMDTLFKEGNAAMIVNGDWSLGEYEEQLGDDLGIAPLPTVSETGMEPAPYTSGKYFMMAAGVEGKTREAIGAFMKWATSEENQLKMTDELTRLPGRLSALEHEQIASDPIRSGSAQAMAKGVPQPAARQMRANWNAMLPSQRAVLAGNMAPAEAAAEMQSVAETARARRRRP